MTDPILITGATDGLGRGLADRLAADGAQLILHGRDPERLQRTAGEIQDATGRRPRIVRADLADLAEVRALAAEIRNSTDRLGVLVNNAGIGSGEPDGRTRRTSHDGIELRFAVNYLAGFTLTLELLPLLRASAPARVVMVASAGQHPLQFDDLQLERGYDGTRAYAQSKLAQIMAAMTLAERVPAEQVTFNSLHPATYMPTKIVMQEIGHSASQLDEGVEATHRLITDPELSTTTGAYFNGTRPARADAQAYDTDARAQLWTRSVALTGVEDRTVTWGS